MTSSGRPHSRRRLAIAVFVLSASAILLAGCGGAKTLSHANLVTRANRACAQADAAVSRLGAPTASLAALTAYAGKVLPISRSLVTELAALKPSAADAAGLRRLMTALQNGNRGLVMMQKATTTAETSAASQIIISRSVPQAAKTLGASTCASSPSA